MPLPSSACELNMRINIKQQVSNLEHMHDWCRHRQVNATSSRATLKRHRQVNATSSRATLKRHRQVNATYSRATLKRHRQVNATSSRATLKRHRQVNATSSRATLKRHRQVNATSSRATLKRHRQVNATYSRATLKRHRQVNATSSRATLKRHRQVNDISFVRCAPRATCPLSEKKSAIIPYIRVKNALPPPDVKTSVNMHKRYRRCIRNNAALAKGNTKDTSEAIYSTEPWLHQRLRHGQLITEKQQPRHQ